MINIFLTTYLTAVVHLSKYSVFHDEDTSIQLGIPWQSPYSYQCLNTKTFAQGNRDYTTETPSISYIELNL